MKQMVAFDLDGTLALSKQALQGDMGEVETWLALSEKRGEPKYSVACEGDGSGYAAGLGLGWGWG